MHASALLATGVAAARRTVFGLDAAKPVLYACFPVTGITSLSGCDDVFRRPSESYIATIRVSAGQTKTLNTSHLYYYTTL